MFILCIKNAIEHRISVVPFISLMTYFAQPAA